MSTHPSAVVDVQPPSAEVYCRSTELSTSSGFTAPLRMLSDVSMPASKPLAQLITIADRLSYALELEKKSQNEVEKQAGLGGGMLNRYANGKRGGSTVNVEKMVAIADVLHVRVEWLLLGTGPVRRGGRGTTPAEEAMALARQAGTPEEVWQATWARYSDRADSMTALDWAAAIHSEAALFARAEAHRVETLDAGLRPQRVDRPLGPGAAAKAPRKAAKQ